MANYKSLRRYYLVLSKLREGRNCTFKSIGDHLSDNDVIISERTLQRDIAQIRADFSVDIIYDQAKKCYYINEETSSSLQRVFGFMEMTSTAEILGEQLNSKSELLKHVEFESVESLRGHENLKVILVAISKKRFISFIYTRFLQSHGKNHEVAPLSLKRYLNRWYLIGRIVRNKKVATFGIDRITDLTVTKNKFRDTDDDATENFKHAIGLTLSGEPVRVVLEADSLQAEYLQALPLHPSQKIISSTGTKTIFEYNLIINLELVQAILRLGDQVKVIEPIELVREVVRAISSALQKYERTELS